MKHTPADLADALDWFRSKFNARTRFATGDGFSPSHDEVLVAEIDRLTALLQPTGDDRERARAVYRAGKYDPHPIGLIAEALAAVRAGERAGHDALVTALETLLLDVQDYEAWQRPCLAVDSALAAVRAAERERILKTLSVTDAVIRETGNG